MNRYEFENLISDYLDGAISFKKQKEFEKYMEQNSDAKYLVKNIRNTISDMNELKKLNVSDNFNKKLLSKVKAERMVSVPEKNTLYGFTPFYVSVLSGLCIALFVIVSQLFNVSENSKYGNNSYQYTASSKDSRKGNKEDNFQVNKNLMVGSNIDSVKNNEDEKKPINSNKIKFVNN